MASQGALNKNSGAVSGIGQKTDGVRKSIDDAYQVNMKNMASTVPAFGEALISDFGAEQFAEKYHRALTDFLQTSTTGIPHLQKQLTTIVAVADSAAKIYDDGSKTEADAAAAINQGMGGAF
jgi:hypothetical protein